MPLLDWLGVRAPGYRSPPSADPPARDGSRQSHPGLPVVPDSAIRFGPGIGQQPHDRTLLEQTLGTADTAARAIRNRVGSLNPLVKARVGVGGGQFEIRTLDDHRLKVLLDQPHPDYGRSAWLGLMCWYYTQTGSAYALKVGDGFGLAARLDPIPSWMVKPLIDQNITAGYEVTDGNGRIQEVPADEMLRIWTPDPDNPFGSRGMLGPNGIATDAAKFQLEHMRTGFENNATPPAVIKAGPDTVQPEKPTQDRFLSEWAQKYHQRNGKNAGLPAWLPPGFDLIQLAAMQNGADMAALLEWFDQQQLRNFGVPRSILGQVQTGDRSSAETNQYVFDKHTILPIATTFANALTTQLAQDFAPELFVEFEDFVSDDKDFELKQEQSDLTLKVRTVNEVRADRDQDPVSWGDVPAGTLGDEPYTGESRDDFGPDDPQALEETETSALPEDIEDDVEGDFEGERFSMRQQAVQFERLYGRPFQFRMRRIFAAQRASVIKRLRAQPPRSRAPGDIFDPDEWARMFVREIVPLYEEIYRQAGQDTMRSILGSAVGLRPFVFTDATVSALRDEGMRLVTRTGETTRRRLTRTVSEGLELGETERQLEARIYRVFDGRKRDARTIARTEVGKATASASMEGARQSGVVTQKRWLHSGRMGDPRHHHADLDGVTLPLNEKFTLVDPDTGTVSMADHPRATTLPASETINCQCDLTYPVERKPRGHA